MFRADVACLRCAHGPHPVLKKPRGGYGNSKALERNQPRAENFLTRSFVVNRRDFELRKRRFDFPQIEPHRFVAEFEKWDFGLDKEF
jgi:hypothetical protein